MKLTKEDFRIITWVSIFAIAMGFLEGAVVVYLRELYYPEGFYFPLTMMPSSIAIVEISREAATLVMLLAIGVLAGKNVASRFAYFLFSFAVWDIVYYFALWLFISWPQSLLEWDVLFLIPVMWTGPVIAPLITSLIMIVFALLIVGFCNSDHKVVIKKMEWSLLISGSLVLMVSFIWDFCSFILQKVTIGKFIRAYSDSSILDLALDYVPVSFNWALYTIGTLIIIGGIFLFYYRNSITCCRKKYE